MIINNSYITTNPYSAFLVSLYLDEDRVHIITRTTTAAATNSAIKIARATPPINTGMRRNSFSLLSSLSASVVGRVDEITPSHAALGFPEICSLK